MAAGSEIDEAKDRSVRVVAATACEGSSASGTDPGTNSVADSVTRRREHRGFARASRWQRSGGQVAAVLLPFGDHFGVHRSIEPGDHGGVDSRRQADASTEASRNIMDAVNGCREALGHSFVAPDDAAVPQALAAKERSTA